jgi:hypothetical protein
MEEIEAEIIMNCKCGRTTHMKMRDFEVLISQQLLRGLDCDSCDQPMVKVVYDPLIEV